jgi:hypothetical protein
MKKYFIILLCLVIVAMKANGQKTKNTVSEVSKLDTLPKVGDKYSYEEVVEVGNSFNKASLYKNAKTFLAETFNSAKAVIEYDDKEEGKIIGNGRTHIYESVKTFLTTTPVDVSISFVISIECKDGKYRYRIYDIRNNDQPLEKSDTQMSDLLKQHPMLAKSTVSQYAKTKADLSIKFRMLIDELKAKMAKRDDF